VSNDYGTPSCWQDRIKKRGYLRIGHRGAAAYEPPNTLRSFQRALDIGVDMIEFDVRWSADHQLVLIHDEELAETTNGHGPVSAYTLTELRRLDAGKGERIPTLDEALELLRGRVLMNVDLKVIGYEEQVVGTLAAHGVQDDVIISTQIPENLHRVRALAPHIQTGISYPEDKGGWSSKPYMAPIVRLVLATMRATLPWRIHDLIVASQARGTMLNHQVATRAVVDAVHRRGGLICVWTVDDPQTMARMRALGVDGIASNRPDLLPP